MSGIESFLDTNVLLYLLSADEPKADRAEAVVAEGGIISVQVLNEFAAVASRKLGMDFPEIRDVLGPIQAICPVQALTLETHTRGLLLAERYGFSVFDAMIVASAVLSGCTTLYSEDLQDGQTIDDRLVIRNPFAQSPVP
jgi:predicted nucleic acid-binding protein